MTRLIPLLFSFFGSILVLQAQTYYVKYDAACMDRYEFTTDIDPTPYVVYTTKSVNGKLTQLDIGKEETKWVQTLPSKLTDCNLVQFDKAMALAINNSSVKIYVVRQSPTHYNLSLVEKATFFHSTNNTLEVTMSDADFVMDFNKMISSKNLGTPASTQEIFLEGTIKYQCLTGYIFRKKESYQSESFKEYTILPQYGIINKRSVPYEGAITNSIRLNKVEDATLNEFISSKCGIVNPNPIPASLNETANNQPGTYDYVITAKGVDTPSSYGYTSGPCNPPTKPGTHVVQKGETLYGISKKYGITVDQLKAWNGIGKDNLISLCQELVVNLKPSTAAPASPSTVNTSSPASSVNSQNKQFHIVKPGESVGQLAAMYGYTEDRFRKMNSLGSYERVYAGQKLFTSDCDCPNTEGVASNIPMPYESETERLTLRGNPDVYFRPIKVHEVRESETPFAIAKLYDTTVDRINELNGLDKNAKLLKGQRIYVQ